MEAYPSTAVADNMLAPLAIPASAWSTRRRLTWTRDDNPRHGSGRGARRRSCMEHQLDEHVLLVTALDDPSGAVLIGRHRCRARRGQWITPVVDLACRCKVRKVYPWVLLYSALDGRQRVIDAYRSKLERLATWLREQHPRSGWAEKLSPRRRTREPHATGWYLRAACWPLFYAWRRVVRAFVAMLLTLDRWWWSLLPVPRTAATARNEQRQPYAPSARAQQRAQVSDEVQATETARGAPPAALDAAWQRVAAKQNPGRFGGTAAAVQEALFTIAGRALALARERERITP